MAVLLGAADFTIIVCMLCVSAAIGLYFRFTGGRQRTTEEFLMAGRSATAFPVTLSIMATSISAITILGVPAEVYVYGTQRVLGLMSFMIAAAIIGYGFLPVYFEANVTTSYDYLDKRFGKTTRIICSILFTVQMMLYMPIVLYAPAIALNSVSGLSLWASIIVLSIVCTAYCFMGGMKAVIWTDVFQACLMYTTVITVLAKACINVGGFQEMLKIANDGGRLIIADTTLDFTSRYTVWNCIIGYLLIWMGFLGTNQAQVQRMLSTGDLKTAQKAILMGAFAAIIFDVLNVFDGIAIYSNVYGCDPLKMKFITSQDQLIPYYIIENLRHLPGVAGLCIAGVFSASLSSMSSAMSSLATVTIEDFIKPYCFCKRLTDTWIIILAKLIVLCYGGMCLLLAISIAKFRGIIEATGIVISLVGGPVLGIYMLGMMTKTANEIGSLIGLLFGFVVNAWISVGSFLSHIKVPRLPQTTEDCPAYFNTTNTFFNGTGLNTTCQAVDQHNDDNSDVLPVYKVSYLWFSAISFLVVFVVGYVSSFVINCFKMPRDYDSWLFSPFVRKWIVPAVTEKKNVLVKLSNVQPKETAVNGNNSEQAPENWPMLIV